MRLRVFVATSNAGKLRDFAVAGAGDVALTPLPGIEAIAAPAENEATFEGNAILKGRYYSRFLPGDLVMADDSGLEVDALGGAPGVRSARFAEDSGFLAGSGLSQDERNNRCLMAALANVAEDARLARYRCVLAIARDGVILATSSGAVEGVILRDARGDGGFGYDPYFAPEGLSQSMAQLDPEARSQLSHRGRALRDLLAKSKATNLTG